jgi:hypothetical protein
MTRQAQLNPEPNRTALTLARLAWLIVFALGTTLFVVSLRPQFVLWQTVCSGADCVNLQLTALQAQDLQRLGLALPVYAAYFSTLTLLSGIVFLALSALIFWRRPDDRMAFLCAIMLIAWGNSSPDVIGQAYPGLHPIALIFQALGGICITLFFLLFPNGRFAPGWVRWLAPLFILRELLSTFLPFNALIQSLFFVVLPIGLFSVFYRYWRVSNAAQRQQTKWVVFGLIVGGGGYAAVLLAILLANPAPGTASSALEYIVGGTALELFILLIPISIGIAILRSRLWDIDILIRRTLVYSLLASGLAVAYFGSVVVLQNTVSALTGQRQSTLVTVLSTLVIAALFVPLRARVQEVIDRRFYRRKYDAARTLAAFGASLRDETNLDQLTAHLTNVVDETMNPQYMGLWLKTEQPSPRKSPVKT